MSTLFKTPLNYNIPDEEVLLIKELIYSPSLTQKEVELVIVSYIYLHKGVKINIVDLEQLKRQDLRSPYVTRVLYFNQLELMMELFTRCCWWFSKNLK